MKKHIMIYTALCIFLTTLATSCKKEDSYDITGDKVNRVFIITDNNTVNGTNTFNFSVVNTPVGAIGKVIAALPVRATMAAATSLQVAFSVDNSLIDSYNAAKGTAYKALPAGLATISSSISIPAGQQVSTDSLKFSIPADKLSQLTEKAYLVPIKLSGLTGDANTQISANQNLIYMVINISTSQLFDSPGAGDMTGAIISNRSRWSATIDKTLLGGSMATLFDGNTNNYFFISSAASSLRVDLGETVSAISGIRLKSYFDIYGVTKANVLSSIDGVTWTDYGKANLATGAGAQYIKFYGTINARYIRLDISAWQNSFIALTEFDLYK